MEISGKENDKCYEAVSPHRHPAVEALQTVRGRGGSLFNNSKEIRGKKTSEIL